LKFSVSSNFELIGSKNLTKSSASPDKAVVGLQVGREKGSYSLNMVSRLLV
jgi:hypothetical protein